MTRFFTDMMHRQIALLYPPKRIVSLVPSQTELLYDLGLREEVVGITKFCVHPAQWFQSKQRVGGTKTLHIETIKSLQPDLIIANKEENNQAQIEQLADQFPVWISDMQTVSEALNMIKSVGQLVGKEENALLIARSIQYAFSAFAAEEKGAAKRVAYFIWYRPWMCAGNDTFIHDMIQQLGWQNVFENTSRYPEVTIEELQAAAPDWLLLSSEPFPFKEKHVIELQQLFPKAKVALVDGEMFSWYGSRMLKAIPYFKTCLNDLNK